MDSSWVSFLSSPSSVLPGVGPKYSKILQKLSIHTLFDLLMHLPSEGLYRRFISSLDQAQPGERITVKVRVSSFDSSAHRKKNQPCRIGCDDPTASLTLVFFHGSESYWKRYFLPEKEILVSGKIVFFQRQRQIHHPDFVGPVTPEAQNEWQGYEPLYPLTQGLGQRVVRSMIRQVLRILPVVSDWLTEDFLKSRGWPEWREALHRVHHPQAPADLSPQVPARQRLAYDEFLVHQLTLVKSRQMRPPDGGRSVKPSTTLRPRLLQALPFSLTSDQVQAVKEIDAHMHSSDRMVRLLQGDVGTGKTIVAFLVLLNAVEAGYQGALMAPTDLLARQHFQTLKAWSDTLGIQSTLLTASEKGKTRQKIYEGLEEGKIDILIGTHALIQEKIHFKELACLVIDEQHRFGVEQRLALARKGDQSDILLMTATPIPRTLMLAAYGDLTCSFLKEKPAHRPEIETKVISLERLDQVVQALERALEKGEKIYWVCPLIEDSEALDLAAAENRFQRLSQTFPGSVVGLLHGRMKASDKEAVMGAFCKGDVKILVSTTVVEVGVDVKDATVMVIDHAERFGLAQLHQLRGRVGRGNRASVCLLLYQAPLSPLSQARLKMMRQTNDGFQLAEEDFRLRGGGEVLGPQQSGLPRFKTADFWAHQSLLPHAHQEALALLREDPGLQTPHGRTLTHLMTLWGRAPGGTYLQAG